MKASMLAVKNNKINANCGDYATIFHAEGPRKGVPVGILCYHAQKTVLRSDYGYNVWDIFVLHLSHGYTVVEGSPNLVVGKRHGKDLGFCIAQIKNTLNGGFMAIPFKVGADPHSALVEPLPHTFSYVWNDCQSKEEVKVVVPLTSRPEERHKDLEDIKILEALQDAGSLKDHLLDRAEALDKEGREIEVRQIETVSKVLL